MITVTQLVRDYGTNSTILPAEVPNYDAGKEFVLDMIDSGGVTPKAIDIDLDVDGILAGLVNLDCLQELGVKNLKPILPKSKRHGIDLETVDFYIKNNYSHVIIPDSSSNNLSELEMLSNAGIKVLIIDHHMCNQGLNYYPDNVVIINNKLDDVNCREVSACMLSYLFYQKLFAELGKQMNTDNYIWGYVTLISDSCKLSDPFIAPLVKSIENFSNNIPYLLSLFMTDYDSLNRNFVSYKFANKINALSRTDNVDLIYELVFRTKINLMYKTEEFVARTNEIYNSVRFESKKLVDLVGDYIEDLGHFGFIDLGKYSHVTSLSAGYLANSTGYISSMLMKKYGKPVIVVTPNSHSSYKGSIRGNGATVDLINLLNKLGLVGGGHKGAIGIDIPKHRLDEFKMYMSIYKVDDSNTDMESYLVIDGDNINFREFKKLMRLCALHNEVAGNGVPEVFLSRKLNYSFTRKDYGKLIEFKMGDVRVKCFNEEIDTSITQLIKPIIDNGVVGIVQ